MKESALLTSELEYTNEPYAIAKIAGLKMCENFNLQYGTNYISVMPTNLYGPNDNFHLENSHVIPGIMSKMRLAKNSQASQAELWGTGKPLREFLWSEDMADACIHIMENVDFKDVKSHINIGSGKEISIADLARLIAKTVGFEGKIVFDSSKPDGAMRKLTDVSKLHSLGWRHKVEIEEGIRRLYEWYGNS
jgi:GDP-L-fucose synthase